MRIFSNPFLKKPSQLVQVPQYNTLGIDVLLGIAVGDALGLPFEFMSRAKMKNESAMGMVGYGSFDQPPGTWSDDTSLSLCMAETVMNDYSKAGAIVRFLKWFKEGYYTPHGQVFDIGITTKNALVNYIENGINFKPDPSELGCGNGSLMRILPLLFLIQRNSIDQYFDLISECSAITHAHPRNAIACYLYLAYAQGLILSNDKTEALDYMRSAYHKLSKLNPVELCEREKTIFAPIVDLKLLNMPQDEIRSTAYVIDSLEASLWAFLHTDSFKDAILQAVNLGGDTDTIGSLTGGLAGIYYGAHTIPSSWVDQVVRATDIIKLGKGLHLN